MCALTEIVLAALEASNVMADGDYPRMANGKSWTLTFSRVKDRGFRM